MQTAEPKVMQMAHLTSFGIPDLLVQTWQKRQGEELLPVQRKAVQDFGLLSGESLLICAPTSSGKTFCGELAAAAAICNRRKAVFLLPLKSIAEEKFVEFRAKYAALGMRVVISSSDHKEFDAQIARGEFDLALIIYEKFNQLLIRNIDLLSTVNLLLVDEVQMLGEGARGASLELALLKVLSAESRPQIVALSGILHEPEALAEWLGCTLLADDYRPVELRQGVLCGGSFHYREHNSGDEGSEVLSELDSEDAEEVLLVNIAHLVGDGEQVLVFAKSKGDCERLAWRLAEANFWQGAETTLESLLAAASSQLSERLVTTLQSSVAFHHAGLSFRQRQILESGFRRGEVKVMVSTTTLAMGVNLPAQTVFIDCFKYGNGKTTGKPLIAPLSWSEYEGMSGRAGRLGSGSDFGRSVLIATSDLEEQLIWQSYVMGQPESLASCLSEKPLEDVLLDLIASRGVRTEAELVHSLASSFQSRFAEFEAEAIAAALARLVASDLVYAVDEQLEASPVGRLLAQHGVGVATGLLLLAQLQDYSGVDQLSWLYLTLGSPDAAPLPHLSWRDRQEPSLCREALRNYLAEHTDPATTLSSLIEGEQILGEQEQKRLRAALALSEWTSELATVELEKRHQLSLGNLLQLAETIAWLLETTAAVAALINKPPHLVAILRKLAATVRRGFDLAGTIIPHLGLRAEQRDAAWMLCRAGLTSATDFQEVNRDRIGAILGEAMTTELIAQYTEQINSPEEVAEMPKLKVSGQERGSRILLNFNSTEIDVSPKSFNYLFKLAAARLLSHEGWLSKEEIEPGFNQAKNIYRVKQELRGFETGLERFIENNKSGHYRINLLPDQILIDFDTMTTFSDLELVELARQVQARQVLTN